MKADLSYKTTDKLKGCPFCGLQPIMFCVEDRLAWNGKWVIECCVKMEECYVFDPAKEDYSEKNASEQNIMFNWNRRVK